MKYLIQFCTINGDWYEHRQFKALQDAEAEVMFHINVSGEAAYGYRVWDLDTNEIVIE